jgi:hypothetical protein
MLNNFKNILIGILAAVIIIAIGASAYNAFASGGVSFSAPNTIPSYGQGNGGGNGNGNGGGNGGGHGQGSGVDIASIPASDLNAEEAAGLLFMREEEKLARDVYNQMFTLWGTQKFQNIASSEQQHMDQIKLLMDRYTLTDPALAPGQFTDANLQALYNQLIAQGSISQTEALKVGALVEQTDIADLQARLAKTDNADIQLVYNNLMNASYNHLAAFTGQTGQGQGGNGQGQGQGGGQGGNGQGGQGQGGHGQGQGMQGQGGMGQANVAGATTIHGVVNSFDGFGIGMTADDGQVLYVQLGNSNYIQSIGFAPQAGTSVTVNGFIGDQGSYTAITVTIDGTGQVYTFRDANGRPMWAGRGNGNGGKP